MAASLSPLSIVVILITVVAAGLSGFIFETARRRQDTPGGRNYMWFAGTVAVWNTFAIGTFLAPTTGLVLLFDSIVSVVALTAAFLWVEFTIVYSGYGSWLTNRRRALLWLEPAAFAAYEGMTVLQGNLGDGATVQHFQGLSFVSHSADGPLAAIWIGVPMLATLLSFVILGRFVLRTRGGYRKQALAVFTGGFVVYLAVAGYFVAGPGLPSGFDPTPLFNAAMAIIVSFALFRLDFLDVVPVASDRLFEEMSDPVVVLASNETIVASNPASSALADEPLDGRELSQALPALADTLEANDEQVTLDTDDGERTYDVETSPLYDPYDRQQGRLAVLRDVTVQRERAHQLQRQKDQLERFAGVVSHDLRNPLAVGRGWAEQARDTGDVAHVERTLDAFDDMEQLIDDLLTLAREGRTVDETSWVALEAVAIDAWPFPDDGPTLTVESTGTIEADRDRLAELLGNCFRNAHDHGSADVRVWIGIRADGFYVEDDGPGIPPEARDDVFESGYSTGADGTGLGLSIVQSIAQAHGWELHVEDGREGGARFVVTDADVRAGEEATAATADPAARDTAGSPELDGTD